MTVGELCQKPGFRMATACGGEERAISSAYICDLLSWVMSHGKEGTAWVTVQTHLNVIAVACLHEFACVIVPENIDIPAETLAKAEEEKMPVLQADMTAYGVGRVLSDGGIGEV